MKHIKLAAVVLSFFMANLATASVIDHADVNGLKTFKDTSTGRVWLDMNNFFDAAAENGSTGLQMISAAQAAGFTFAKKTDVTAMLMSLPLTGGEWASYASVMGYGIPRQLIWGMYDDEDGAPYGWAYAYNSYTAWGYSDNTYDPSTMVNVGIAGSRDLGIFAYQTGSDVPEPASLALMGLGIAGLLVARRRKPQA
jgi:hypothetical protein